MSIDRDEIQRVEGLIDKYLSGRTSGLEEAALRDFFAKRHAEDIPVEWQPLKAMFAFVDDEREQLGRQPVGQKSMVGRRRYLWAAVSAAASILLVCGIFLHGQGGDGCYMVVDGKVYTDRQQVRAGADEALRMVGSRSEDPFQAMDMMRR